MENLVFSRRNQAFKENKIKRVLRSKTPGISDENIRNILCSIDFESQYFIKAMRNPKKFLNFLTEEKICREDECFESKCFVIYGDCRLGLFEDVYGERRVVPGSLKHSTPAAAVKTIAYPNFKQPSSLEHLLIVYEPKIASAVLPQ